MYQVFKLPRMLIFFNLNYPWVTLVMFFDLLIDKTVTQVNFSGWFWRQSSQEFGSTWHFLSLLYWQTFLVQIQRNVKYHRFKWGFVFAEWSVVSIFCHFGQRIQLIIIVFATPSVLVKYNFAQMSVLHECIDYFFF